MLQRLCVRIRSTRLSLARMQRTLARTSSTVAYSMLAFLPVSSPRAERVCCLRSCDCDSPAMPFAGVPVCVLRAGLAHRRRTSSASVLSPAATSYFKDKPFSSRHS